MVKEYFQAKNVSTMFPFIEVTFFVENPDEHYHIPLLIAPHSFTSYRGG